ncbi:MAG: putative 2-aminoethylphosphonate ABC transporter ATP-binding protein [Pseudomonadales bacterium]|nr:putative 2-aminoethylphosphonate ABC transporter ATP-binding protein [Pseudomonadales bacterium]
MTYLNVDSISKNFEDFNALERISFTIEKGEFICFLGPSGCGKTTLLRIIAGLENQSSGRLEQNEIDISHLPVKDRDFGIVFQSYALFPNLTVSENIEYGLRSLKMSKSERQQRVAELLELMALQDHHAKYPTQLSGGQQQRVALARAIALKPGLLLLDEPLSALDAQVRTRLRGEITGLQRRLGITTIMVTHDQEEAMSMADRIVVMNHGRIEQIGTPNEIYSHPASRFVAEFVGTMNTAPCQIKNKQLVLANKQYLTTDIADVGNDTEHATVGIRPEHIELDDSETFSSTAENVFAAQIEHIEFQGRFTRLTLNIDGWNTPVYADISLTYVGNTTLRFGQQIQVRLPARNLHLFTPGGAPNPSFGKPETKVKPMPETAEIAVKTSKATTRTHSAEVAQ